MKPRQRLHQGLLVGLLASTLGVTAPIYAQTPDSFDPAPPDIIRALAVQSDDRILIGGFGRVTADGVLESTLGSPNGRVSAIAIQPDKRILLGGMFSIVGGQARFGIVRLNVDSSVDTTFDPRADGEISAFVIQPDGKILVGGSFRTLSGSGRDYVGRLNPDGSLDTGFLANVNAKVNSLALQPDGKILAGGWFTNVDGQTRKYVCRLNTNGSLDPSFDAGDLRFSIIHMNAYITTLAIQPDGKILISGDVDGFLLRLNADGNRDTSFSPMVNEVAESITLQANGKILLGGLFSRIAGTTRKQVGRLNGDGSLDTSFDVAADDATSPGCSVCARVRALAVEKNGSILLGGEFTVLGGQNRLHVGRVNNPEPATENLAYDGSAITWLRGGSTPEVLHTTFDYSTNRVDWISLGTGTRILGGWRLSGLSVPLEASIRARGFVRGGQYNGSGWFVESGAGPIFITGEPLDRTNQAGTTALFRVVALGSEPISFQWRKDNVDLSESGNITGVTMSELILSNVLGSAAGAYSVVVSNSFGSVTSRLAQLTVVDPVVKVQPSSQTRELGEDVTFTVAVAGTTPLGYQWLKNGIPLADATTTSLSISNVQVADAGRYQVVVTNDYGSVTSAVAVLTLNISSPDGFNPNVNGDVYALAIQTDGKILIGGRFTTVGGQPRTNLARVYADGALDGAFAAAAFGSAVYSLLIRTNGTIVVGGEFTTLAGHSRTNLGRLNSDGTIDESFDLSANGPVFSLATQADGKILVGGWFSTLGSQSRSFLGRLNIDDSIESSFAPQISPFVYSLMVQPDGKILVAGSFFIFAGQIRHYLGRLHPDGTLDSTFNAGIQGNDDPLVSSLALQPDGKIVLGGVFERVGGQARTNLARVNPNGSLDASFSSAANGPVSSLALQTDGKILVGGNFTTLAGENRTNLGRLHTDGSIDATISVSTDDSVDSLAVQADGNILAGGKFTAADGLSRSHLARLINTVGATQTLTFNQVAATWLRNGSSPEISRATFDFSTNGLDWNALGTGTRIPGGWQLTGLALPNESVVRARGQIAGGKYNGSEWFVDAWTVGQPKLSALDFGTNGFRFTFLGLAGAFYDVEYRSILGTGTWVKLEQRAGAGRWETVVDPSALGVTRFYRIRASVAP